MLFEETNQIVKISHSKRHQQLLPATDHGGKTGYLDECNTWILHPRSAVCKPDSPASARPCVLFCIVVPLILPRHEVQRISRTWDELRDVPSHGKGLATGQQLSPGKEIDGVTRKLKARWIAGGRHEICGRHGQPLFHLYLGRGPLPWPTTEGYSGSCQKRTRALPSPALGCFPRHLR